MEFGVVSLPHVHTTCERSEKGLDTSGSLKWSMISVPGGVGCSAAMNIPPWLKFRQVPFFIALVWVYSTSNWIEARAWIRFLA